ncbi:TRAP-type mannitol/chloroaromatic compound transport system permease small subunit [Chelatococcus composti]|uniref:TRAP transporter small permease protein n=1 Tax=Chelatococcus composti TaxID=1743235 RepID=A0A841KBM4_9HYPH|nr:TRAP transporter small permease subunit [Chelatococcus composti]MBB6168294.1 TRAP-type mannitol/chloroaromatic compound transport system permease small subunit [Chelatococcus composti]
MAAISRGKPRARGRKRSEKGCHVSILLAISRAIDAVNTRIGRWLAWLIVVAIAISAVNAVIRKAFDISSNAWLELQWVLFGAVFLLCSPWTLIVNEHIRIDVVHARLSARVRQWIELFGTIFFLLPLCIVMLLTSIPFAERSYAINEQSLNAGGLPQWPAKMLVPLGFALLLVQAISELIKRIAVLRGDIDDPHADADVPPELAEAEQLIQELRADPGSGRS